MQDAILDSKQIYMVRLQKLYKTEIVSKMKADFGYQNDLAVPRVKKVVINVGAGRALKEPKLLDIMINNLKRITGQTPVKTMAKKAVSGFGIKKGLIVGLKVTLRGKRMYEFLDKLANVSLARIRDFKGLARKGFDGHGNYTVGIKEQTAFPEIRLDEVEKLHGMEISIATSAKTNKEAVVLLKYLGFPIEKS